MTKGTRSASEGLVLGILAGIVLAIAEVLAAMSVGLPPDTPVRMAASLGYGPVLHVALSAAFGLVYGIINSWVNEELQQNPLAQAAFGTTFGLAIYALNFQVIARAAYPWFLDVSQAPQLAMHALAFGLPLGLMYAGVEWRVHTVPRHRPVYASR